MNWEVKLSVAAPFPWRTVFTGDRDEAARVYMAHTRQRKSGGVRLLAPDGAVHAETIWPAATARPTARR